MNNEKVKEIRIALCKKCDLSYRVDGQLKVVTNEDILTLINELESENLKLLEENENLNGSWENARKRITEWENENKILRKHNIRYYVANNYEAQEQLKQFAERLKSKDCSILMHKEFIMIQTDAIDETLKEFMDGYEN